MIIYQSRIYRADLRANPNVLYVFGDNVARRGLGGQAAEMRGEPNAVGIATKWAPTTKETDYFYDSQYDEVINIIFDDMQPLRGFGAINQVVVVPLDGIGTGLSELPTRAPKIYKYICSFGLGGKNVGNHWSY